MKQEFKIDGLVQITDIYNLDLLNDETGEQDIFLNDIFIVKEIHFEDDNDDLVVLNQRTNEELLIGQYRFITIN